MTVGRVLRSPHVVLAVLCAATLAISLATTAVNIALPVLVTDLHASTRDLQWIVDAYNLLFATFVLAFGSLSDRYGRKGALTLGLIVFAGGSIGASHASTSHQLIAWQALMGLGAAFIFPTTLSILSNVFLERRARARAIGIWGAATGLGVACGPVLGGWLLESFWWGSVYLGLAAAAILALALAVLIVPTSRDPEAPALDHLGLVLSVGAVGSLVYTIIDAPERGWLSARSLVGFAVASVLFVAFTMWERRRRQPMVDVGLFANMRFTAASASITFAYFALFGFIFLITQYFQVLRDYSPLMTGVRMLPVAASIAIGSLIGAALAVRIGNKVVVATGLLSFTLAFGWLSTLSTTTSYLEIALQMIPLGLGLGLTSAPATEAIMGAVPENKAGIGSAMNDATRELGGTLGVAVIGSIFASIYASSLHDSLADEPVPDQARLTAEESIGAAKIVAEQLAAAARPDAGHVFLDAAYTAFLDGLSASCLVAAGVTLFGSAIVAIFLPAKPKHDAYESASNETPLRPSTPGR